MAKADRRVKKTRQALQQALITLILEQGYETITVQDVLDRANVGRSTFYAHFYDLEDLLYSEFEVLQAEIQEHMANYSGDGSLWDLIGFMFQHAEGYSNLYKVVIGKESGRIIQANLHRHLSAQIRPKLAADYSELKNSLITLDILENHLVSSFMALLTLWLDNRLACSAEDMAQIYRDLVKEGLNGLKAPSQPSP